MLARQLASFKISNAAVIVTLSSPLFLCSVVIVLLLDHSSLAELSPD